MSGSKLSDLLDKFNKESCEAKPHPKDLLDIVAIIFGIGFVVVAIILVGINPCIDQSSNLWKSLMGCLIIFTVLIIIKDILCVAYHKYCTDYQVFSHRLSQFPFYAMFSSCIFWFNLYAQSLNYGFVYLVLSACCYFAFMLLYVHLFCQGHIRACPAEDDLHCAKTADPKVIKQGNEALNWIFVILYILTVVVILTWGSNLSWPNRSINDCVINNSTMQSPSTGSLTAPVIANLTLASTACFISLSLLLFSFIYTHSENAQHCFKNTPSSMYKCCKCKCNRHKPVHNGNGLGVASNNNNNNHNGITQRNNNKKNVNVSSNANPPKILINSNTNNNISSSTPLLKLSGIGGATNRR